MIVRVYFYKENDAELLLDLTKISEQAFLTLYDVVWEREFKNILSAGRIWMKFKNEKNPFGISMSEHRNHDTISVGDVIQIATEYYMVNKIGIKKIKIVS